MNTQKNELSEIKVIKDMEDILDNEQMEVVEGGDCGLHICWKYKSKPAAEEKQAESIQE